MPIPGLNIIQDNVKAMNKPEPKSLMAQWHH